MPISENKIFCSDYELCSWNFNYEDFSCKEVLEILKSIPGYFSPINMVGRRKLYGRLLSVASLYTLQASKHKSSATCSLQSLSLETTLVYAHQESTQFPSIKSASKFSD